MMKCLPLCVALVAAMPLAGARAQSALLRQIEQGFVEVYEKVAQTVVVIDAHKAPEEVPREPALDFLFRDENGEPLPQPEPPAHSEGSGFIIRPDGHLLTNRHVIEGAAHIEVRLKDGRRLSARLVGADERTDIAVLKIDATGLTAVEFGDSDAVRVGQLVCAIGVPYNLDYSFTCGWVSAKNRANLPTTTTFEDYIQTDAFINPGNSGGPLFDVEGRVIGMNTLINGIGRGLAFAIPSNMLRAVADELIARGKVVRPWLGIRIQSLGDSPALATHFKDLPGGVIVETIEPDAPAYTSDLRPADVITRIDGTPLKTARDLQAAVLRKKIGQTVQLTVWRNNRTLTIPVVTGQLPDRPAPPASSRATRTEASPRAAPDFGLDLQDVTPELVKSLGLRVRSGALVTGVRETGPAARANLQRDDVITEVERKPVVSAAKCREIFARQNAGNGVLVFIDRRGTKTYAVLRAGD